VITRQLNTYFQSLRWPSHMRELRVIPLMRGTIGLWGRNLRACAALDSRSFVQRQRNMHGISAGLRPVAV